MAEKTYKPQKRQAEILDRAYELIQSVPYRVGARWLFYRLLQEGYYSSKHDYKNKMLPMLSDARHAFYKDWRPDTLVDETRESIYRGHGSSTAKDWMRDLAKDVECQLAVWHSQRVYVELWFEARAMSEQFEYYTEHLTLRPMGGQPSIDYKWQIAKSLETIQRVYNRHMVVLYFGDLDKAGGIIQNTVESDVRKWCTANFDFINCGLTLEQVQRYNVPENEEKPGSFQWEALSDEGARDIITSSVEPFISRDGFSKVIAEQNAATDWLRGELARLIEQYGAA